MGPMPDESDDDLVTDERIDEYARLLEAVTQPVTKDEAHVLVRIFPPITLYEVEWTLIHLIESVFLPDEIPQYKALIEECNSEVNKEILKQRLESWQQTDLARKSD